MSKKRKEKKVYYYSDEVNDDFANTSIHKKVIDENFKYYDDSLWGRFCKFFIYRIIANPLIFLYLKLIVRVSYKNKKCLRGYKKQSCFIFGNHTGYVCDAFSPTYISFPRSADVVVNSDATSIKGLAGLILDLGALPIPDDFHFMPRFVDAMDRAVKKRHWIAVYPEAHIWPYYTKVRPFKSVSFRYPVKYGAPVFSYTMTYNKKKIGKKPKRVVYIDGPFFPDPSLNQKQAADKLRNEVYAAMCKSAEHSNYSYVDYVYKPKEN